TGSVSVWLIRSSCAEAQPGADDADHRAGYRPGDLARTHFLPSGLLPSVQEFHLVNRPLAATGSRTFTAGSDFHRPRSALASTAILAQSSQTPAFGSGGAAESSARAPRATVRTCRVVGTGGRA